MADAIRDGLRLEAIAADIGEPPIIATVAGVGYRIGSQQKSEPEGGDRG